MILPKVISDTCSVSRNPPINLQPDHSSLFAHELHKILPPVYSYTLGPVQILPNGFILKPWSILPLPVSFSEQPSGFSFYLKAIVKYLRYRLARRSVLKVSGPCLFITDQHSNGFFHWCADVLPRLALLESAGLRAQDLTLVVPSMAVFSYLQPSLLPFAFKAVVLGTPFQWISCSSLTVLGPPAPTGNYRPQLLLSVTQVITSSYVKDFLEQEKSYPEKKIYISRSQARRRTITNESEVLPVLQAAGYEIVHLETLSFPDQVRLLSQAHRVLGLHGAGLTNMLWMPQGSLVIEIRFPQDADNNCYFSMASALGHRYAYYLPNLPQDSGSTHQGNLQLDPDNFAHFLTQF